ncbi:MAG TPA: hypothetical protein VLU92_12235 [Candidatus Dormibacteraeota bacterium]|nr:hypothetical protein [Candidatus Dormibacteraeota bacterium]
MKAMGRKSSFALLASVLIAGCALGGSSVPVEPQPTGALAKWNDFPAGSTPRPILLLQGLTPNQAFTSGDAKIAFMCGSYTLGVSLPADVPTHATVSWASGESASHDAITAAEAYAALKRNAESPANQGCGTVTPLRVTQARFAPAAYETDRGTADISSWLFTADGAEAEIAYPALPPSALWGGGWAAPSQASATVSPDDRSLVYHFVGAPAGDEPCSADYIGLVSESATAVALDVQITQDQRQASAGACDAVGHPRSVTVPLKVPLGGRVVVDKTAAVMPVCREGAPC